VILSTGEAAAQAVDPIQFAFTGGQGLNYEFDLATPSGTPLDFYSNDPTGTNFVNYSANLSGVSLSSPRIVFDTPVGTVMYGDAMSALSAETPEPATWALMLVGFGAIGLAMRWRASEGRAFTRIAV
jgi:PEP-CTERM motif